MKKDLPFASDAAEAAYQAGRQSGARVTRDHVRNMLQAFQFKMDEAAKNRETMLAERAAEEAAKWFPKAKSPKKKGVYRTSRAAFAHTGGARGFWDGIKWRAHENWGDYSGCNDMVWLGVGPKNLDPIEPGEPGSATRFGEA